MEIKGEHMARHCGEFEVGAFTLKDAFVLVHTRYSAPSSVRLAIAEKIGERFGQRWLLRHHKHDLHLSTTNSWILLLLYGTHTGSGILQFSSSGCIILCFLHFLSINKWQFYFDNIEHSK